MRERVDQSGIRQMSVKTKAGDNIDELDKTQPL